MSDCVFCSIADGEASAHRLYEDDRTLAFLDGNPANRGHTLVIPKDQWETVLDMRPDLVADVFRTVWRIAGALETAHEPDGISIVQSNGRAAGQAVFHAHVHVVPRYEGDEVTLRWTLADVDEPKQRNTASAIREKLDSLSP